MKVFHRPRVDLLTSSPDPLHWSREFVEHLRAVHFALIAVSAGLILLGLSAKQYNALAALVQVEEVLQLKKDWSLAWIQQYAETEPPRNPRNGESTSPSDLDRWLYSSDIEPIKETDVYGQVIWSKPQRGYEDRVVLHCLYPKENWHQLSNTNPDWSPSTFPRTLNEFASWWEGLKNPYTIYVPSEISDEGQVWGGPKRLVGRFVRGTAGTSEKTLRAEIQLTLDVREDDDEYFYVAMLDGLRILTIPINQVTGYKVTQGTISRGYLHSVHPGDFGEVFSDLSRASEGGWGDLELETLRGFIHDEASKGPEVFEAFGMKFPSAEVTLWGIILLLSIQLYLLLYLRQLSGKLDPADAAWQVPWIGMNPSGMARCTFFVTVVPLPVLAVMFLIVRRALASLGPRRDLGLPHDLLTILQTSWPPKLFMILSLFVCFCSLVLAAYTWRYRPLPALASPLPEPHRADTQGPAQAADPM